MTLAKADGMLEALNRGQPCVHDLLSGQDHTGIDL